MIRVHWDILVCLEGLEHDHDAYYHAHPAVLDGMFQLITLVDQSLEGESWEPSGIIIEVGWNSTASHLKGIH